MTRQRIRLQMDSDLATFASTCCTVMSLPLMPRAAVASGPSCGCQTTFFNKRSRCVNCQSSQLETRQLRHHRRRRCHRYLDRFGWNGNCSNTRQTANNRLLHLVLLRTPALVRSLQLKLPPLRHLVLPLRPYLFVHYAFVGVLMLGPVVLSRDLLRHRLSRQR
jgi:hypothetical protein